MKMKKYLSILMIAALAAVMSLTGCSSKGDDPIPTYTVTFNSQGGSSVNSITDVAEGAKITRPNDPVRENYSFAGWYRDAAGNNIWNFATDAVTSNVTLYAKWIAGNTYVVTFNSNGGSAVDSQTVGEGGRALRPNPSPTMAGLAFVDWYRDAALNNVYDFDEIVTANITLYAQWSAITQESLGLLIDDFLNLNRNNYTIESFDAVNNMIMDVQEIFYNPESTQQEIESAYNALSTAMAALVELPHVSTTGIYVSPEPINGVIYVIAGEYFSLYAYGEGANGMSTDSRVTFIQTGLEAWANGDLNISNNNLSFTAKSTLTAGAQINITVRSADVMSVTSTVTLRVVATGELKQMFLNKVNSLPVPAAISYEHYETIYDAREIYFKLSYDERNEAAVVAAKGKLDECMYAYEYLPERYKYSFNGNICNLYYWDGPGENDVEAMPAFTYTANGAFPSGTYLSGWEAEDVGEYGQYRLILRADGTATTGSRYSSNPSGANPSAWDENNGTYTYTGSKAAGGVLYLDIDYDHQEVVDPQSDQPKPIRQNRLGKAFRK